MKIALIALHFAEYATRLALALAVQHTVQLHLTASNAGRELHPGLRDRLRRSVDLRVHPHPARKYAPIHGARLAAALRRFRPDVVHAQEAAEWTVVASRMLGPRVPLVLTVHDPLPHSGQDMATRRRTAWASARLRRGADAAIVHGESVVPDMLTAEPSLAGRVHSVMHGILGEPPSAHVPRRKGTFLFFGRIEAYKGLGVLLEAARLLDSRGLAYELTIAGRGGDLDEHRATIAALPNITLDERYIPADEVASLFARSAAVVMPYLDATQSGVAAHAFAAGTPAIASRVGALPDIVRDGFNGLLVPTGDAAALADALDRALGPDGLADRLAAGAAETAAGPLSWQSIAEETQAVYASAIRRARAI